MKAKVNPLQLNSLSINIAISILSLLLGIIFGCIFAEKADSQILSKLINSETSSILNGGAVEYSLFSAFLNFSKYPSLLLFLACSAFGIFLMPCVVFSKGFFLSISVASVISTFGKTGILAALSLFGFQSLVLIPVILFFSAISFDFSKPFLQLILPQKKRLHTRQTKASSFFLLYATLLVILFLFAFLDTILTPKLVTAALKNILQ